MKKSTNKWLIAAAALSMMALTWMDNGSDAFSRLSPEMLVPVLVITAVIYLFKTSLLSALLIALKKLWERLRGNR